LVGRADLKAILAAIPSTDPQKHEDASVLSYMMYAIPLSFDSYLALMEFLNLSHPLAVLVASPSLVHYVTLSLFRNVGCRGVTAVGTLVGDIIEVRASDRSNLWIVTFRQRVSKGIRNGTCHPISHAFRSRIISV
jgi:hypothetical protein